MKKWISENKEEIHNILKKIYNSANDGLYTVEIEVHNCDTTDLEIDCNYIKKYIENKNMYFEMQKSGDFSMIIIISWAKLHYINW